MLGKVTRLHWAIEGWRLGQQVVLSTRRPTGLATLPHPARTKLSGSKIHRGLWQGPRGRQPHIVPGQGTDLVISAVPVQNMLHVYACTQVHCGLASGNLAALC